MYFQLSKASHVHQATDIPPTLTHQEVVVDIQLVHLVDEIVYVQLHFPMRYQKCLHQKLLFHHPLVDMVSRPNYYIVRNELLQITFFAQSALNLIKLIKDNHNFF